MWNEERFLGKIDRGVQRQVKERSAERREDIKSVVDRLVPLEIDDARNYLTEEAIDIETFKDLYGEQVVERDQEAVARLQGRFAVEDKAQAMPNGPTFEQLRQLSEITESYLLRGLNEAEWIPFCKGIKTSDYDDYMNGVDMVLEYQRANNPAHHLGLGVDVTFSNHLEKKLEQIKQEIEVGRLVSLKYFDSPASHFRGELRKIPRAVVGFDIGTIRRLAKERQLHGSVPKNDPLRFIMLEQLRLQTETYAQHAESRNVSSKDPLRRNAEFIKMLNTFVTTNQSHDPEQIRNNEQVVNFRKTLATVFERD